MEITFIAILLAILLGIVQYLGENIYNLCGRFYKHIISLSAGIAITYLFLDLFPFFSFEANNLNRLLFIFPLIGFVIFHIVEKYAYQHSKEGLLETHLSIENQVTSFIYHFILGIIILDFSKLGLIEVFLFFIPVLIFTAVDTLPINRHPSKKINFFVSTSTLIGVLFAGVVYSNISKEIQTALLGIIIGILLFSVIRHSIPMGKEGKPIFFIIGVLIYSLIILIIWYL
jgi:hypothetical protein